MRRAPLIASACAALGVAQAAKPDPALYPTPNTYRAPGVAMLPPEGRAKLIREHCPGGGRGLVHFLEVDGAGIRVRGTWPTYVELAPGPHRLLMECKGPAASLRGNWEGDAGITFDAEPGRAYVVRYLRTDVDRFRAWIEPYERVPFAEVGLATSHCDHPPYADPRLHK